MRRWGALLAALSLWAGPAAWAGDAKGPPPEEEEREEGVSPGEEEEILGFIKGHNSEMHDHLLAVRGRNPRGFRHKMREMRPMLKHPEARDRFVRNMKGELKVRKLAQAYRQGEDKEAVKKELRAALGEQFDAKLSAHEARISIMQKEIESLKEKIQKRKGLKDKLVEKRLNELTGEEESWDW